MSKFKKVMLVLAIVTVFSFAVQIVMAETLGFDLIDMLKNKVSSMADSSTTSVEAQLEDTKDKTLTETSMYLDRFISDVIQNLDQYVAQETDLAKERIKEKGKSIENIMDSQKQGLIENAQAKIKDKIEIVAKQELNDFDKEISQILKDKLKY